MNEGNTGGFPYETVFTWQATPLKLGLGATRDVGFELRKLGARSTLVVTDRNLSELGLAKQIKAIIEQESIEATIFDEVEIEPTDHGCEDASRRLSAGTFDSFVGLGGGSSIDTAKVLNLLYCNPGDDLRRYLNKPIGAGAAIPRPLLPLVAMPTTAGSGSECTAMVALDIVTERTKTGLGHPYIRPNVAIVDPLNTISMPPAVTASSGYDVLSHACESLTARRFDRRPPYRSPEDRPMYVGANPISDIWVEQALQLIGRYFRRAVHNPWDVESRTAMAYAAAFAGMGFGSAGTHIPHANAYPIAGLVREYLPAGYQVDHALVPHGQAVISTAGAAFEFTYPAAPELHLRAAELLGANLGGVTIRNGRDVLPATLSAIVADTAGPASLSEFGYCAKDLPLLVENALKQERLLSCCPRAVTAVELHRVFDASLAP